MKPNYNIKEIILLILNTFRCIPHLVLFYLHKNKSIIEIDMKRAYELMEIDSVKPPLGLIHLLSFYKTYRNLFYFRTRPYSSLLNFLCPGLSTLNIVTKDIGMGFAIIHGGSSEIGAKSIGKNCIIYQQVTIGGAKEGAPTILDNVTIYAAAVIIGNITIGNNVVVGANATVFRDVPDNCTVLPGTSKIMKWKSKVTRNI